MYMFLFFYIVYNSRIQNIHLSVYYSQNTHTNFQTTHTTCQDHGNGTREGEGEAASTPY